MSALRDAILEYVTAHDHVSFAELHRELGSRFNLKGSVGLSPESFPTILYWAGMSRAFSDAIRELTAPGGPLVKVPCPVVVYLIDGYSLTLPIARRPVAYRSDHWLPVILRPRVRVEGKGRKRA